MAEQIHDVCIAAPSAGLISKAMSICMLGHATFPLRPTSTSWLPSPLQVRHGDLATARFVARSSSQTGTTEPGRDPAADASPCKEVS